MGMQGSALLIMMSLFYFIQSKFNKKVSYDYKSDREEIISVKNKWLNKDIDIKIATLEDGSSRNEISFVDDGKLLSFMGNRLKYKNLRKLLRG